MRTPITYYGGKQRLTKTIVSMIPPHKVYIEPFFGGGAVFFAKTPSYLEVINDINDNIVTFYRVCQNEAQFQELSAKIQSTLFSEALFLQAKTIWNGFWPASDVERAWAVWVCCNYAFNATPYGGWKWDMGTAGSHSGIVAAHKRNAFTEEVFKRLQFAQISCRNAIDVLRDRSSEDSFAYIDPPYIGSDQKHYHGYGETEFTELLNVLRDYFAGKFVLSTFANDIILDYAEQNGWNVFRKDMPMTVANLRIKERGANSRRKEELLVFNYELPSLFEEEQL